MTGTTSVSNRTGEWIRRILISWLAAITLEYFLASKEAKALTQAEGVADMSLARVLLITALTAAILTLLSRHRSTVQAERWGMVGLFSLLSTAVLYHAFSPALLAVCLLVSLCLTRFALRGWFGAQERVRVPLQAPAVYLRLTVTLSVLFFLFVSLWDVCRVFSFSTPTYDFGIFAQMFHSMKTHGLPLTTLERDGLLSHFRVHMSPIYYLLLPFYCLIPYPATLQVLQAAVITSAVIPLWKIGTHHALSGLGRCLLCTALLLYPAFSGGTSYDLHENCFLTPLILWLFCGIDRKSTAMTAVSALLLLGVKEDAAVYVAVIGLWLIVRSLLYRDRRGLITGSILFSAALLTFFLLTHALARYGDGVMTDRYRNFMYGDSASLLTVVRTVLVHPMKAVFECVDAEKLSFLALTMLPLLGLPLLTRRYERYLLLIPYILVNLMPDYIYQHDIFFQYTFGSTACLFYLAAVNLADMKVTHRALSLIGALTVSTWCFISLVVPKAMNYPMRCVRDRAQLREIRAVLSTIPPDASVTAGTLCTTFLSGRDVLYDLGYASEHHLLESEYVVIHLTYRWDWSKYETDGRDNGLENLTRLLRRHGYEEYALIDDKLLIFHKKTPPIGSGEFCRYLF